MWCTRPLRVLRKLPVLRQLRRHQAVLSFHIPGAAGKRRRLRRFDVIEQNTQSHDEAKLGPIVNDTAHMPKYTREQIRFEDHIVKTLPKAMLDMLERIHINLGHPSGPDLVRYLTLCGASADTFLGARALRCTAC